MKIRSLLALGLLAFLPPAFGQGDEEIAVPKPTPTPTPIPTPTKVPTKKPEPLGVIEGVTIPRGSGFLGIAVVGGNFRLSFYDAKKKPVAPDVLRATLRWSVNYQPRDERLVLNPSADGKSLTSPKGIRPPLAFKLYITLIAEGTAEGAGETFQVDFRG